MTDLRGLGAVLAHADRLRSGRTPFVLATVVRVERPTSVRPGDRALVLPDGSVEGFVGGICAEATVRDQALRLLAAGQSGLLRITPGAAAAPGAEPPDDGVITADDQGVITVDNPCLSGGMLEIFLEAMVPPPLVVVIGTSPVAQALSQVGVALGYDVRAAEAAPTSTLEDADAVVVASHGRGERDVLRAALAAEVPYVALVASRRRGAGVLASLGLPEERTARVSVPAGLDIGARSPGEIAVSVYAEFIARRRSASAQTRSTSVPAELVGQSVPAELAGQSARAELAGESAPTGHGGCCHA